MIGVALALALGACSSGAPPPPGDPAAVGFDRLSADTLAHGERVSRVLGCTGCHGPDLTGRDWSDELGTLWTANLTRTAEAMGDAELAQVIRSGRRSDRVLWDMPSHLFTELSASDMAALVAYIRSKPVTGAVHPDPTFGPELKAKLASGEWKSAAARVAARKAKPFPHPAGASAQGRYIVQATCAECHGEDLRGGAPPFPGDPERPNLLEMVPAYDAAAFAHLLRTGEGAGGRKLGLMREVATGRFAALSDAEITAVRGYIAALAREAE